MKKKIRNKRENNLWKDLAWSVAIILILAVCEYLLFGRFPQPILLAVSSFFTLTGVIVSFIGSNHIYKARLMKNKNNPNVYQHNGQTMLEKKTLNFMFGLLVMFAFYCVILIYPLPNVEIQKLLIIKLYMKQFTLALLQSLLAAFKFHLDLSEKEEHKSNRGWLKNFKWRMEKVVEIIKADFLTISQRIAYWGAMIIFLFLLVMIVPRILFE